MPMEVEEHGARDGEKEDFGEVFRIPYSNEYNSGGAKNETKHNLQNSRLIHTLCTTQLPSPDLCSQFSISKQIKKKKVSNNPSLWAELSPSEVDRGHGVVKRARAF